MSVTLLERQVPGKPGVWELVNIFVTRKRAEENKERMESANTALKIREVAE